MTPERQKEFEDVMAAAMLRIEDALADGGFELVSVSLGAHCDGIINCSMTGNMTHLVQVHQQSARNLEIEMLEARIRELRGAPS